MKEETSQQVEICDSIPVRTSNAEYYPLYDFDHRKRRELQIPEGTDHYVPEIVGSGLHDLSPYILPALTNKSGVRFIGSTEMDQLAKLGSNIVIVDVNIPRDLYMGATAANLAVAVGPMLIKGLHMALSEDTRNQLAVPSTGMSRRKFLKLLVAGSIGLGAMWGGISHLFPSIDSATYKMGARSEEMVKLEGMYDRIHPEFVTRALRSLVVAHKMLTLDGIVAYSYGFGHRGIEVGLQMGREYCLSMLQIYPKWLWKTLVNHNDGIRNIAMVRSVSAKEVRERRAGQGFSYSVDYELETFIRKKLK